MLDDVAACVELTPGARTTVRTLRRRGFRCGAVSGGFSQVVQPVATELGLDFSVANKLDIQDGLLTGRVVGKVIDRSAKAAVLHRFASSYGIPLRARNLQWRDCRAPQRSRRARGADGGRVVSSASGCTRSPTSFSR